MYYDNEFEPVGQPEYTKMLDNISVSSDNSSLNSNQKKQKKYHDLLKASDKNYHKIKRRLDGVLTSIDLYNTTTTPGSPIRGAITGTRYPFRVGSRDEYLFYKVAISTPERNIGPDNNIFYFDNPEQYERMMGFEVSQEAKEMWHDRYITQQVARNS